MWVLGVCVGPSDRFERHCLPSLEAHCADAPLLVKREQVSIAHAYNQLMAEALALAADGLILLHDDVELRSDPRPQLQQCMSEPSVAIVGAVGSRGAAFHWWPDGQAFGYAEDTRQTFDYGGGTHEVDVVDGLIMALSPWAMRNLRFDASIGAWHGYDSDICTMARLQGKRVLVTDLKLFHHARPLAGYDTRPFGQARANYLLKWRPDAPRRQRLRWGIERTRVGQYLATSASGWRRTIRASAKRIGGR
jgi:GT2 family glycosyltransferase